MSSYLQQSYLGAWDDDRPSEGIAAKIGWGLRTSAKAVGGVFASGAAAVKTAAVDVATGTNTAQRDAEAQRLAASKAAADAAKTRTMLLVGAAVAAGIYFYSKRK